MKIISKKFDEWSPLMQYRLQRATFGDHGFMQRVVRKYPHTLTYVAFNKVQVMGWLLTGSLNNKNAVMIFINVRYRKMGVATELLRNLNTEFSDKKFNAFPHDRASRILYERANARFNCIEYNDCGSFLEDWECHIV